jgi:1-acyl-sn-glycerol-3-phosphate acyltransferase
MAIEVKRQLARLVLKITRFTRVGEPPQEPKYVLLCAPHTTNWDLLSLLMASWSTGANVNFLAKHQLFRGPLNRIMRMLGGVPVRRDERRGMVDSLADEIAAAERMALAIPAAGTRSHTDHWKSGFYRIALAAGVPIGLAFVDYSTRTVGFGPTMVPSEDVEADLDVFRAFYADKRGKFPDQESEIRFRDT